MQKLGSTSQAEDGNPKQHVRSFASCANVRRQATAFGAFHGGVPITYPFGRMTRGDFNYIFFYWLQPIYHSLLYQGAEYHETHVREEQIFEYKKRVKAVAQSYHSLVKCNYGFNGNDRGALEDSEAYKLERAAGISP